jgi:hypothetical protein
VEVGKLVVTITTKKESKKEKKWPSNMARPKWVNLGFPNLLIKQGQRLCVGLVEAFT